MKYSNNISLPYPVLGINDDVFPLLDERCIIMGDPIKSPTEYVFEIELNQYNDEISGLISSGKAEYACEVTCKDTYLRRCFHSSSPYFCVTLSRYEVKGRVNFSCFVAVKEPIVGYSNSGFNEDYQGYSFDLEVGDMLVVFPMAHYNTDIKFDKLYAAGSFMQIVEAADNVDKTWFNLDDDRIKIELPHDLFEQYQRIGNAYPEIIHSSLVHNALVYALCNIEEYLDSGKLWADSIIQRLQSPEFHDFHIEEFSSDMMQVYRLADALLQDPYRRLLGSLENMNKVEEEED